MKKDTALLTPHNSLSISTPPAGAGGFVILLS